jgi:polyisoprenoid-binding protein YceI
MSTWIFEPGHTEPEFRARHMMVTWVAATCGAAW